MDMGIQLNHLLNELRLKLKPQRGTTGASKSRAHGTPFGCCLAMHSARKTDFNKL